MGESGSPAWSHGWVVEGQKPVCADVMLEPGIYYVMIEGQNDNSGGEILVEYAERFESRQAYEGAPIIPVGPTDREPGIYYENGSGDHSGSGVVTPGANIIPTGLFGNVNMTTALRIGIPAAAVLLLVFLLRGGTA